LKKISVIVPQRERSMRRAGTAGCRGRRSERRGRRPPRVVIGEGVIVVWAGDQLPEIDAVAPALLDAVIAYLEDGNAWAAAGLSREPGVGDVRIEVTKTRKDDSRGRPRIDSSGAGFAKIGIVGF
jgi:hypothetical protein